MPYITQNLRPPMNTVVDQMVRAGVQVDGDLNYILFKYCKNHVKPSYNNYKNFIGELNEAAEEIRRRILAPYEDKKIIENGDVE